MLKVKNSGQGIGNPGKGIRIMLKTKILERIQYLLKVKNSS